MKYPTRTTQAVLALVVLFLESQPLFGSADQNRPSSAEQTTDENFHAEITRAVNEGLRNWRRSKKFPVKNETRVTIRDGFYECEEKLQGLLNQKRLDPRDIHDYLIFLVDSYMDDLQDRKLRRMNGGFFARLLEFLGRLPVSPAIYIATDGQQVSTASPDPSDVYDFSPSRWLKNLWRALTRDSVRLEIQSVPEKAKIELDGKSDPDVITNTRRKVWPGPHQLTVINAAPAFSCDKKVVVPINGSACYVCRPGQAFQECQ